jgi:hypothetical protein
MVLNRTLGCSRKANEKLKLASIIIIETDERFYGESID